MFLERLYTYAPLPSTHIAHLGALYALSTSPNAEIRLRFYTAALRAPRSAAARAFAEPAARWVVGADGTGVLKGRMKFCRPVLRAVAGVDPALARRFFEGARGAFHPIARKLIEKVSAERRRLRALFCFVCSAGRADVAMRRISRRRERTRKNALEYSEKKKPPARWGCRGRLQ